MNKINKININNVEYEIEATFNYASYGLPVLYVNGDISTMDKDNKVTLNYVYGDKTGTLTMKWQGSSSLAYPKKNYTIVFDEPFEAKEGWGEQKKYCLKANYIDFSHARNIVSAKLWGQVVKTNNFEKNLIPYPYVEFAAFGNPVVKNGITFTCNDDGSITIEGTATASAVCTLASDEHLSDIIGTGNLDTIWGNTTNEKCVISGHEIVGEIYGMNYTDGKNLNLIVWGGQTVNATIYPQIELGSVATEWIPRGVPIVPLPNLINGGAVDGFPICLILNGNYQGLYTFNIPKDSWMMGMGEGENEAIVCSEGIGSNTGCDFRAEATIDKVDNVERAAFSLEYAPDETDAEWVKSSLNNLINSCINSDGSNLNSINISWDSVIDYLIFTTLLHAFDCTNKNYILATYDGVKWYFSAYDLDSTYGLWWDGTKFLRINGDVLSMSLSDTAHSHRALELAYTYKKEEIKKRYAELRGGVLSEDNIIGEFSNFIGSIPKAIYDEEVKIWKTLPNTSTNNLSQITDFYKRKLAIIDKEIEAL